MLEAGLALIAACLPSVYVLSARRSLQSIIASVRSAISLHSIRLGRSRASKKPYENVENPSLASHEKPLKRQVENSNHEYSAYKMDDAPPMLPQDGENGVKEATY
jgi:hypothetical protein